MRRQRTRRIAISLALALAASGMGTASSSAAVPGTNGQIAFRSDQSLGPGDLLDADIFALNPDGTGLVNLTPEAAHQGVVEDEPSYAPNGDWMVFRSTRDRPNFGIWRMDADGSNKQALTNSPTFTETQPSVSPEGSTIIFTTNRPPPNGALVSGIWAMDADGSNERPLIHLWLSPIGTFNVESAEYSPDGSTIVFDTPNSPAGIFTVGSAGFGPGSGTPPPTRLTTGSDRHPTFSPDGNTIAFERFEPGVGRRIWTMNADGTSQQALTGGPGDDFEPVFSPDGTKLAFRRNNGGFNEIIVRDLASGAETNLTNNSPPGVGGPQDIWPAWQPLQAPADTVPPMVTGTPDRPANANGWYDASVVIDWIAVDPEPSSGTPSDPPDTIADTEGASVIYESDLATDPAGNSATGKLALSVDLSDPTVSGSASPVPGAAGWNTGPVTVTFDCQDAVSGIDSCTSPATLANDGADQSTTGEAIDLAGRTTQTTVDNIDIDQTAPTIGAVLLGQSTLAIADSTTLSVDAADATSGLAGGEFFVGADPGVGNGTALALVGSALSAPVGAGLSAGVHEISVRARDVAGNWSGVQQALLVVYDPAAGFATGGGWIVPGGPNSDPGDLLPGLDGTSKANFGFSVKYQNGQQTVPGGNLNFRYNAGGFRLKSASMDWLVVTNSNWAKFQGLAEIDGMNGLHPFRVDARDGSNGQPDRFVMKVWAPGDDPDQNGLVYKASGDVEGGQIKIHR